MGRRDDERGTGETAKPRERFVLVPESMIRDARLDDASFRGAVAFGLFADFESGGGARPTHDSLGRAAGREGRDEALRKWQERSGGDQSEKGWDPSSPAERYSKRVRKKLEELGYIRRGPKVGRSHTYSVDLHAGSLVGGSAHTRAEHSAHEKAEPREVRPISVQHSAHERADIRPTDGPTSSSPSSSRSPSKGSAHERAESRGGRRVSGKGVDSEAHWVLKKTIGEVAGETALELARAAIDEAASREGTKSPKGLAVHLLCNEAGELERLWVNGPPSDPRPKIRTASGYTTRDRTVLDDPAEVSEEERNRFLESEEAWERRQRERCVILRECSKRAKAAS